MADKSEKFPDNMPGAFYVDRNCIACDACVNEAPENFMINEDDGHSFVMQQPRNAHEEAACRAAIEACPVEAIGADGDAEVSLAEGAGAAAQPATM